MLKQEEIEIKAIDDNVTLKFGEQLLSLNEKSRVHVFYQIDEDEELKDIDETAALVLLNRIEGYLENVDDDNNMILQFNITPSNKFWKIRCSSFVNRINGQIFPHTISIDVEKKEIFIAFNVFH